MAVLIEMPIRHPARQPNPFRLRKVQPNPTLDCPYECGQRFEGHWKLYLHLLQHHPEQRDAQR